MALLQFSAVVNGIQEAEMKLSALYDSNTCAAFEARWESFFHSDGAHPYIYQKVGKLLRYQTGYFVPTPLDNRPPLLLLFGNPASHSTRVGMCFSYEGNQRKHRFWSVLAETGFLDFRFGNELDGMDTLARNTLMKRRFLMVDYTSPFRIGIAPILSMPSTASTPPWSGVGGLYRLFGKRAMTLLLEEEKKRVHHIIQSFWGEQGLFVAFQKDAYESVRSPDAPAYSLEAAKAHTLESRYLQNPAISLLVAPPTRFWTGQSIRQGLRGLRMEIERRLIKKESESQ